MKFTYTTETFAPGRTHNEWWVGFGNIQGVDDSRKIRALQNLTGMGATEGAAKADLIAKASKITGGK
jgi:hypothetical protein